MNKIEKRRSTILFPVTSESVSIFAKNLMICILCSGKYGWANEGMLDILTASWNK